MQYHSFVIYETHVLNTIEKYHVLCIKYFQIVKYFTMNTLNLLSDQKIYFAMEEDIDF